jgi:small subunit ribosomal protein S16
VLKPNTSNHPTQSIVAVIESDCQCRFTADMVVRLRLAVHGPRNDRIFHLVAINGRKRRNAKPIETLGMFKARSPSGGSKCVEWNPAHIKRWLDNGAQPSERVVRLLELVCDLVCYLSQPT